MHFYPGVVIRDITESQLYKLAAKVGKIAELLSPFAGDDEDDNTETSGAPKTKNHTTFRKRQDVGQQLRDLNSTLAAQQAANKARRK